MTLTDFDDDHPADALDLADVPHEILGVLVRWGDFLEAREFPTREDYTDVVDSVRDALALASIVGQVRQRLEILRDYLEARRAALP